jgi:hypothetical protein
MQVYTAGFTRGPRQRIAKNPDPSKSFVISGLGTAGGCLGFARALDGTFQSLVERRLGLLVLGLREVPLFMFHFQLK